MTALQTPLATERKRIPQDMIDNLVNEIAQTFKPQRIILFGSYARGNPRPESDIDLLVVIEEDGKGERQSLTILRLIESNWQFYWISYLALQQQSNPG